MKLTEPVTTLTDYILAAESLFLAISIFRNHPAETSSKLWAAAFVTTALAALCGGTFHGLVDTLSTSTAAALWKITVYSIGISSLLMLSASALAALQGSPRRLLLIAAFLQFAVYAFWMARHNDFRFVIYDYGSAMIAILLLQVFFKSQASPWIIAAILISFAGAAVQQTGFRSGKNWNHNDLYHFIQMFAIYLLYRGGLLLKDLRA